MRAALVVTEAVVAGRAAQPLQVRIEGGTITAIAASVERRPGDLVLPAGGARLLVGLHDHHLHLRAQAAAATSLLAGPPAVRDRGALVQALGRASPALPPGAWLRAVGYHESVAGILDRHALDAWVPERPVRVQHRGGALWMLNSAALDRLGLDPGTGLPEIRPREIGSRRGEAPGAETGIAPADTAGDGIERDGAGRPTGRLWRMDAWLGRRLAAGPWLAGPTPAPSPAPTGEGQAEALGRISAAAARWGVTGFTDATPDRTDEDLASLAALSRDGILRQRLHLMVRPDQPAGRPEAIAAAPLVTLGPVKVMLDDDRLPTVLQLTATVGGAHRRGRPAAVHCVTAVQLVVALAAFADAGAVEGDRIEHGAMIPAGLVAALAASPLTVVTQPGLVAERGDSYRADVPAAEQADLWRAASLQRAGVRLAAGSDAPHGPAHPWRAMEAATLRRTPSGAVLGPAETVDAATARRWWSGRAERPADVRTVAVGAPADLLLATPGARPEVTATIVAGRVVYRIGA